MKTINNYITEMMNNSDIMNFAIIVFLLKKVDLATRKYVLNRVDDKFIDDLRYFIDKSEFDNIPDLLGDEDADVLASYIDDITDEEANNLIR